MLGFVVTDALFKFSWKVCTAQCNEHLNDFDKKKIKHWKKLP